MNSSLRRLAVVCAAVLAWTVSLPSRAADHGDTPLLIQIGRHDARLTDLHAFRNGDNLVLSLSTNPAIPVSATSYTFPSDLTLRIYVDRHSRVSFEDADAVRLFGGTIESPEGVRPDLTFTITFDEEGDPSLDVRGLGRQARERIQLFAGLRDDPFINGLRSGRNVASIVLEMPLADVLRPQAGDSTILVWAKSDVPNVDGPDDEHAGRNLRSQVLGNEELNTMGPADHWMKMGVVPDVVIYDTSRPAGFPNGRLLTDDIIDMLGNDGDPAVFNNPTAEAPTANDVPFLATFPYLAPPQSAP
jgi:hypothetical protein